MGGIRGYLFTRREFVSAAAAPIIFMGAGLEQMFDLSAGLGETRNLVREKSAQAILKQHRELPRNWIAETRGDSLSPIKDLT